MSEFAEFPAWRHGPDGQSVIVNSEAETPKGYVDHPSKLKGAAAAPAAPPKAASPTPPVKAPPVDKAPPAPPVDKTELDADGHVYDPALHAATQSKTQAGLWRMKVGVARPAAAPGYPLDL